MYTQRQQTEIDHHICWEILETLQQQPGFQRPGCDLPLHVGDVLEDFEIPTESGPVPIRGAVVEGRHIDAVQNYRANCPMTGERGTTRLRIEPPAGAGASGE